MVADAQHESESIEPVVYETKESQCEGLRKMQSDNRRRNKQQNQITYNDSRETDRDKCYGCLLNLDVCSSVLD